MFCREFQWFTYYLTNCASNIYMNTQCSMYIYIYIHIHSIVHIKFLFLCVSNNSPKCPWGPQLKGAHKWVNTMFSINGVINNISYIQYNYESVVNQEYVMCGGRPVVHNNYMCVLLHLQLLFFCSFDITFSLQINHKYLYVNDYMYLYFTYCICTLILLVTFLLFTFNTIIARYLQNLYLRVSECFITFHVAYSEKHFEQLYPQYIPNYSTYNIHIIIV
eukprot:TRINITY_DN5113_c1_g1_i6.p1 TRINITY_DN5113_c1_g1~~TRINITY_DN5113_c1_g1_i6.p1  ORF type:complete len:219 (-),score=-29.71 TRINITY_DN5113_c1_g1_i6:87-743(-)